MSELCMYELEDNVWDEFGTTDDHIVPHSISDCNNQYTLRSDSHKKPRLEEIDVTCNAAKVTKYGMQREENKGFLVQVKDTMLEKDTWSHSPDGAFLNSGNDDSHKQVVNIICDDQSHERGNGKIECVASEFCSAVDDLNFFNDDNEGKDNSELLFYNWPDIENFEDVDSMFRNCDTTFGLENLSNEDELCWFSSSHVNEGSEGAFNSNTELDVLPQQYSVCEAGSTRLVEPNDVKSRGNDDLIPVGKISRHKLLFDQAGESEEQKEQNLDNGGYFQQYDNIVDPEHPIGDSYSQALSPSNLLDRKQRLSYDSSSHIQNYVHLNNGSHPDQISLGATISCATSENNGCPSTKNSSFRSNPVKSTESSLGPFFEGSNNDRKITLHQQQGVQGSYECIKNGKKPARKLLHQAEQDGYSDVKGGSSGVRPEIDSSNNHESSCLSSAYDEISLEATSFRQLQQVMEKLDIRTKLCIRDSLYRLARSAVQRHNCTGASVSFRGEKDDNEVLMTEETDKCTRFMDIETDTNPIDRSIAHLLFHRPSDPSLLHSNSTSLFKSQRTGHINSTSMMAEELVGCEDAIAISEKMVTDSK